MQTIGLIGGMSWESTLSYYRHVNEAVRDRGGGGLRSAQLLLWSVDFATIEPLMRAGRWDEIAVRLGTAGQRLVAAGADFLVLCTNTMHKLADSIEAAAGRPLLHIVDPTATALARAGLRRAALLGTRFTMEEPFYRERLERRHGIAALVPDAAERTEVNRVIFDELCRGQVRAESRARYAAIVDGMVARGAEAVILGCTEIAMLLRPEDVAVPLFDTAALHAVAAAERALAEEGAERG